MRGAARGKYSHLSARHQLEAVERQGCGQLITVLTPTILTWILSLGGSSQLPRISRRFGGQRQESNCRHKDFQFCRCRRHWTRPACQQDPDPGLEPNFGPARWVARDPTGHGAKLIQRNKKGRTAPGSDSLVDTVNTRGGIAHDLAALLLGQTAEAFRHYVPRARKGRRRYIVMPKTGRRVPWALGRVPRPLGDRL